MLSDASACTAVDARDQFMHLRIASIFIILVGSSFGALFPVLAKRSSWLRVPNCVFDFAKYFGSGVIIGTAFIHLLSPAISELSSQCLPSGWSDYPYALAFCLLSIFTIFIIELVAFRWGTSKLKKVGKSHDAHGHNLGSHAAHRPEGKVQQASTLQKEASIDDPESGQESRGDHYHEHSFEDSATTQLIGVAILEFGVVLHSVLIGLTLAVHEGFKVLFAVIVFHQTFEGLGIGSRLAHLQLPVRLNWIPMAGAILFGITTPIGIAIGLGIKGTYNPESATASIVSGILDALSSGILVYTGLVELFAHEFLFNQEMMESSNGKLAYAVGSMCLGCAIMALLGKWA